MKSVLKGLTFAVLTVSFGLSMMPKASAEVLTQPAVINSVDTAGNLDTSVMTLPAVIDNSSILTQPAVIDNSLLTQPAVLGTGCGTCNTLVQPAIIDNGCNTCGGLGLYGSGILTQPAIYGGYGYGFGAPFYGWGMRRGFFGGGWY